MTTAYRISGKANPKWGWPFDLLSLPGLLRRFSLGYFAKNGVPKRIGVVALLPGQQLGSRDAVAAAATRAIHVAKAAGVVSGKFEVVAKGFGCRASSLAACGKENITSGSGRRDRRVET